MPETRMVGEEGRVDRRGLDLRKTSLSHAIRANKSQPSLLLAHLFVGENARSPLAYMAIANKMTGIGPFELNQASPKPQARHTPSVVPARVERDISFSWGWAQNIREDVRDRKCVALDHTL
nr:hypothetical protein CFP56_34693 [Quercus suber]